MPAFRKFTGDDEFDPGPCSFCGARPSPDTVVIAGRDAVICDHCLAACAELAADDGPNDAAVDWEDAEPPGGGATDLRRVFFRLIGELDVARLLSIDDLLEALPGALLAFSTGRVVQPVRAVLPVGAGGTRLFVMPAYVDDPPLLGAKLVSLVPDNAALDLPTHLATIVLFSPQTGALVAVMDGRLITELRTAAVSALSARLLARRGAARLAIIGSGVQARSHLLALERVAPLAQVRVWSPTPEHVSAFLDEMSPLVTAALAGADTAEDAVDGAEIVVLATSASLPVIRSGWISDGAHVISVGACQPDQREMDPALIERSRLYVDSRDAALSESGDIVMGVREGRFAAGHIRGEIGELLAGTVTGRQTPNDVTLFKSLGLAVEDVVAADLVYRRAVAEHAGKELEL